jgi:hypothetical protein
MRTIFLLLAATESALARGGGGSSCHGAHCAWDLLDGLAFIGLIIVNIGIFKAFQESNVLLACGVALVSAALTLLIVVLVGPIVSLVVLMVGLFMVMNWDHNKKQNERGQRL